MLTQTESDNIARVKRGFEAFNAGDMATLHDLFDPDVRWLSPGTGILEGTYEGRDALFAFFATLDPETDGTFRSEPLVFAGAGEHVFVNVRATGARKGHKLDLDEVLMFRVVNGKVREVRLFIRDHTAAENFWA